jgi:hypothetical protein
VAIVAVIAAVMVLAGTAAAQAATGTLDHDHQAVGADMTRTTTTAAAGAEDQDSPASANLMPVCDVFCDYCDISPFCDPCIQNPFLPQCGPFPGPPDPPEEPEPVPEPVTCDTYNHTLRVKTKTVSGGPQVDIADVTTHVKWCWNSQEVTEVSAVAGTNWTILIERTTVGVSGPDGPGQASLTDPVSGEPAGEFKVTLSLTYEFTLGPLVYKDTCSATIDGWYYQARGQHYFRDYDGCSNRNLQTTD